MLFFTNTDGDFDEIFLQLSPLNSFLFKFSKFTLINAIQKIIEKNMIKIIFYKKKTDQFMCKCMRQKNLNESTASFNAKTKNCIENKKHVAKFALRKAINLFMLILLFFIKPFFLI